MQGGWASYNICHLKQAKESHNQTYHVPAWAQNVFGSHEAEVRFCITVKPVNYDHRRDGGKVVLNVRWSQGQVWLYLTTPPESTYVFSGLATLQVLWNLVFKKTTHGTAQSGQKDQMVFHTNEKASVTTCVLKKHFFLSWSAERKEFPKIFISFQNFSSTSILFPGLELSETISILFPDFPCRLQTLWSGWLLKRRLFVRNWSFSAFATAEIGSESAPFHSSRGQKSKNGHKFQVNGPACAENSSVKNSTMGGGGLNSKLAFEELPKLGTRLGPQVRHRSYETSFTREFTIFRFLKVYSEKERKKENKGMLNARLDRSVKFRFFLNRTSLEMRAECMVTVLVCLQQSRRSIQSQAFRLQWRCVHTAAIYPKLA